MTAGGTSIKKQLDDVNQQILQLEPMVIMKNPRYQPPKEKVVVPLIGAKDVKQIEVGMLRESRA